MKGAILGLTLIQPWAWCICHAGKRVENRTWKPWCPIDTYLAIHAGQKRDRYAEHELQREGIAVPGTLPLGQIVAVARLVGTETDRCLPSDQAARWWSGPVGWVLDDVAVFDPVPCKGAQGLWRVPDEVLGVVRERWKARAGQ